MRCLSTGVYKDICIERSSSAVSQSLSGSSLWTVLSLSFIWVLSQRGMRLTIWPRAWPDFTAAENLPLTVCIILQHFSRVHIASKNYFQAESLYTSKYDVKHVQSHSVRFAQLNWLNPNSVTRIYPVSTPALFANAKLSLGEVKTLPCTYFKNSWSWNF